MNTIDTISHQNLDNQSLNVELSLELPLEMLTETRSNSSSTTVSTPMSALAVADGTPEVLERLETLDDVIFPAIDGDEEALDQVEPAWREAVAELGPEVVQESRNQYLRYARNTWEFLRRNSGSRHRMLALLHVIALLSGIDM